MSIWLDGRIGTVKAVAYIMVQLAGAVAGALVRIRMRWTAWATAAAPVRRTLGRQGAVVSRRRRAVCYSLTAAMGLARTARKG